MVEFFVIQWLNYSFLDVTLIEIHFFFTRKLILNRFM